LVAAFVTALVTGLVTALLMALGGATGLTARSFAGRPVFKFGTRFIAVIKARIDNVSSMAMPARISSLFLTSLPARRTFFFS